MDIYVYKFFFFFFFLCFILDLACVFHLCTPHPTFMISDNDGMDHVQSISAFVSVSEASFEIYTLFTLFITKLIQLTYSLKTI